MHAKNVLRLIVLGASFTALFAQDTAPAHRIEQKNRGFSVRELTIRRGAKVEFCNIDDVTHNVFSKSNANAFNIKTQMPGNSSIVEFVWRWKVVTIEGAKRRFGTRRILKDLPSSPSQFPLVKVSRMYLVD